MLLVHRTPGRAHYPDAWSLPGGHVEPGENPVEAVRREVREELGVGLGDLWPVPVQVVDQGMKMYAFIATSWVGEPANLAPDEHDELKWFAPDELSLLALAHPESAVDIIAAIRKWNGGDVRRR